VLSHRLISHINLTLKVQSPSAMTTVPLRMRPIAVQKLPVQASLVRRLDNMSMRGGTVQVWACIGLLKFALILRRHRVIISHRKGPEIALVWVCIAAHRVATTPSCTRISTVMGSKAMQG
jgi:hypothetical protein